MIYNPVKEISIDMFGKCISGIDGMEFRNWLDVGFSGSCKLPMAKPVSHLFILHTHEVTEDGEGIMFGLIKTKSLGLEIALLVAYMQSQSEELPACGDLTISSKCSSLSLSFSRAQVPYPHITFTTLK